MEHLIPWHIWTVCVLALLDKIFTVRIIIGVSDQLSLLQPPPPPLTWYILYIYLQILSMILYWHQVNTKKKLVWLTVSQASRAY